MLSSGNVYSTGNKEFMKSVELILLEALKLQQDGMKLTLQEWIYNEAMDVQSLQKAGTFNNALLKKIDEHLTAIFAEIIACINRFNNLLILTELENDHLVPLWFEIFNSKNLCQRNILKGSSAPGSEVSSVQMIGDQDFTCKFPFSWTVFTAVENTVQDLGKK